jgi:predicted regulator of Ras-like GTPase activity (Roadblock/LC7/MglB family)
MVSVLQQLNAIPGVMGSLVCDEDGKLLGDVFPPLFDKSMLEEAATLISNSVPALPGLEDGTGVVELRFQETRILIKPLVSKFLLLFCQSSINISYLNITMKVAVKRLEKLIEQIAAQPVAPSPPPVAISQPQQGYAAPAPFVLQQSTDCKSALLTVQLLARSGGSLWDQMVETVAINRETSIQISNMFKTTTFKRLKLVNKATGKSKAFPVQIISDDRDHRYDGKIIISLACMELLKVKEGEILHADPNIGGGMFGWEGI